MPRWQPAKKPGPNPYYGILNGFWFCDEALANGAALSDAFCWGRMFFGWLF